MYYLLCLCGVRNKTAVNIGYVGWQHLNGVLYWGSKKGQQFIDGFGYQ